MLEIEAAEAGVQRAGQRLAACNQSTPPPAPVAIVFLIFFLGLFLRHMRLDDLLYIANLNQHVLWLQVGMDDAALPVEIIQSEQHLLGDLLHKRHGNTSVVPALNQTQQVLTQHLKDHTYVNAVGSFVFEGVQQTHNMLAARVGGFRLDDPIEELDFVDRGLSIMSSGAHNLQRNVLASSGVL